MKEKFRKNKNIFFSLLFVVILAMFFSFGAKSVQAEEVCEDVRYDKAEQLTDNTEGLCSIGSQSNALVRDAITPEKRTFKNCNDTLNKLIKNNPGKTYICQFGTMPSATAGNLSYIPGVNNPPVKEDNSSNCVGSFFTLDFSGIITCLLSILLGFGKLIVKISATLFIYAGNAQLAQSILDAPIIYGIWSFIRDLVNMFFVIILLFSAFATIFQIESFNYKKILFKLIFAALLINFSFPITRIIIDISNVLMFSIIKLFYGTTSVGGGSLIAQWGEASNLAEVLAPSNGSVNNVNLLASVVLIFLFGFSFLAFGCLLIVRLIALMIAIIASPFAFVAVAVPNFGKYFSTWMNSLVKYAFFGPIMMMAFYIAFSFNQIISAYSSSSLFSTASENTAATTDASLIASMVTSFIPVMLLWMGMGIASKMSIAGANETMGRAQKFAKWVGMEPWKKAYKGSKWLAKQGAHKFERDVLAKRGLSPTAFKEAWKARQAELDTKKFAPATGKWRDKLNKVFEGRETRYEDAAHQSLIAQRQKEMEAVSKDAKYLFKQLQEAEKSGDKETAVAALRIMAGENDLNDLMAVLQPKSFTPKGVIKEIQDRLGNKKFDFAEGEIDKHIADIGDIGFSKGNFQLYGGAEFDSESGRYKVTTEKRQRELALGKAQNLKAQTKADLMHYNSLFDMIHDGKKADGSNKFKFVLSEFGKGLLKQLNDNFIEKNLARVRDDFVDVSYSNITQIHNYANVELKNEATELRRSGELEKAAAIENKISLINKFVKEIKNKKENQTKEKEGGTKKQPGRPKYKPRSKP